MAGSGTSQHHQPEESAPIRRQCSTGGRVNASCSHNSLRDTQASEGCLARREVAETGLSVQGGDQEKSGYGAYEEWRKSKLEEDKIFLDVGLSKKWAGVALNQMGRHEQRAGLCFDPSVLRSKHPDFQSSPAIKHPTVPFNSSVPGAGLQLRITNFYLWSSLPLPSISSPSWQPMRITMVSFTLRQGRHTGACTRHS